MKKLLLFFLVTMLPKVVNANPDKVCINGLYFDCFNYYGANTCRFTADFNGVASSTYTGRIEIPSTITYQNVTYTVRRIGANVFYNSGVTYVYLPNTITQFDGSAFEGATNLKYIVSAIEDPQPSNGDNYPNADYIFGYSGINESCILVVPQGTKSTYTTKNWAKNVKGGVYENAYFKLDNKTRSYGDANPTLSYSYATLENIISEPTYSCNATNTSSVGNYQISFDNKVGVVASGVATFVDGTLTITKAPLTITAKSYTIKQGEALPSFEATYSGFKNGQTSSVLTTQPAFNCSATSSSAPGTYDITVSGAAAQNYSFNYVKGTLTITDADPVTVTANSCSREYGEANPAFGYTSSGATLNGTPSITCSATATSPVGNYAIVASQGTVTNYNVTYVNGTLTITKAPLTITAKSYTIKQGEALPSFEATYSGFKNGQTSSVLTTQPAFNCSATSSSAPGTYDIIVSGAAAQNYSFNYVKGTLTITDADPVTVTANSCSREYGEANPAFGYTSSGAVLSGTPSITCSATATSPVGNYAIVASQGTVTNYNVTYVNGTLTITKAPLTITAKSYTIKQGESLPSFEAEYSGFKNGETSSVLTTQPTISTTATSASEPGTYDITISGASATNYNITHVKGTLTITQADAVTVTAKSYSRQYGESNPAFEYTSSGAALSGTPSITCTATATSPVGDYPIVITKGSVTNYNDTYVNGTLTVTKAPLTITAKNYTIKQGKALPSFEAEYTGFKNGETSSVLTTQPTISCSATSSSAPGTYGINVSGAAAQNYSFNYVNGTLTITDPSIPYDAYIDGIYYIFDGDDAIVTYKQRGWNVLTNSSYNATAYQGDVVIPSSVNFNNKDYSVTSIGERAFDGCSGLTSIVIPSSVTSIGDHAFNDCSGLTSIEIPNSVTSIGDYAFGGCSGLTSIVIPNSVTSISEGAFSHCSGLTSVTIPNSVTSIGDYAFYVCSGLTSVTIPNSVTSIGIWAFSHCSGLTSVTIPNSVTSIDGRAFNSCSGLTSINVDANNSTYDSRGNCNAIIETSTNTLVAGCKTTVIPNSVTSIGDYAFGGCSGLTSITIPNSVTSIGDYAFGDCSGLTSIVIPNSVTSIGRGAFSWCSGLTSVTIPNSVTSIGNYAFSSCTVLTSIEIPNSVTSIGNSAFSYCSGLTSITIPTSVTSIGNSAFQNCYGLTSVTIPNSVTSIGSSAFEYSGLNSVTIPYSVTSIGEGAFKHCTHLTSITIPHSVTSIGEEAFYWAGLTSVTIPNSVTSIGNSAFLYCFSLTSVKTYNSTPIGIGGVFYTSNVAMTLYVPRGSKAAYQAANGWKDFSSIVEFDIIQGDANDDSEVNVSDIVEIVNYIMNKPSILFVFETADINEDDVVNVTDIVGVASGIMSTSNNAPKRSSVFEMVDNDQLEMTSSDNQTLSINLQNEGSYVASQFDIVLSAGQTLESIQLNSKRMNNHLIAYAKIADNRYKVVIYSLDNATYKGHSGELLNIKVAGSGDVSVEDILFVTAAKTEKRFPPLHRGATGISVTVTTKPTGKMDIYSIDGRLVRKQAESTDGLKKGLYIINGKKQIIR